MLFVITSVLLGAMPAFVHGYPGYVRDSFVSARSLSVHDARTPSRVTVRSAVPYSSQFPYLGAQLDGKPGTTNGSGGIQVPMPGDTAHYFQNPPPGAMRGPCPGLNTLANHGFISRDGITTYTELVAALQNAYNVDYHLAIILSVLGLTQDGDPITEMLSIGGSTMATQKPGAYFGYEGGLSRHNSFELDVSLTRDDYAFFGDDATFNATLFGMMADTVATTSSAEDPLFDIYGISLFRAQRYNQSRANNPNLVFNTGQVHNYGAASFLYEVFGNVKPDLPTISSFFGAVHLPDGSWGSVPERFPVNYTNRVLSYTGPQISNQSTAMYQLNPVPFGSNDGLGNFIPASATNDTSTAGQSSAFGGCGLYNTLVTFAKSSDNPNAMLTFVTEKLNPVFTQENCTLVPTP